MRQSQQAARVRVSPTPVSEHEIGGLGAWWEFPRKTPFGISRLDGRSVSLALGYIYLLEAFAYSACNHSPPQSYKWRRHILDISLPLRLFPSLPALHDAAPSPSRPGDVDWRVDRRTACQTALRAMVSCGGSIFRKRTSCI